MRAFVSYRRQDWSFVHPMVEQLKQYIYGSIFIDYRNIDEDDFEHSILQKNRLVHRAICNRTAE